MHEPTQSAPGLQTWKLTLAYDGTDFRGWQVQPGQPTIQGELQCALGRITGEAPLPQGSGRTDAGVHALAQVASFALRAPIPPANLLRALNRTLPPSIRVLETSTVPDTFHARHSAVAKTYEYRIHRGEICPPVLARYVYAFPLPMDLDALQEAARLFQGEHDFLSFAATDPDQTARSLLSRPENTETPCPILAPFSWRKGGKPQDYLRAGSIVPEKPVPEKTPQARAQSLEVLPATSVRTIYSSRWQQEQTQAGSLLVYQVRGNGFLHHMVRNLVGTMLEVGRGNLHPDQITTILAARTRSAAGPTAPARGLFLHSVEYPTPTSSPNHERFE